MALSPCLGVPLRPVTSVRLATDYICLQIPCQFRLIQKSLGCAYVCGGKCLYNLLTTFHEQQQKRLGLKRSYVFGYIKCGHLAHSLSQALD